MPAIAGSLLDDVVRRLAGEFDPDRIILFGSHAWGTPTEQSDIDLLVIVPRSDERPNRRATRAHRCLRGLPVPLDVIVKTRAEMGRFGRVPASLEAEILERGKLLYAGTRRPMMKTATVYFDGRVLRPEEPLDLEPNRRYLVTFEEAAAANSGEGAWDVLERLAGTIDAPPDWSEEHDHYLRGTPRRASAP